MISSSLFRITAFILVLAIATKASTALDAASEDLFAPPVDEPDSSSSPGKSRTLLRSRLFKNKPPQKGNQAPVSPQNVTNKNMTNHTNVMQRTTMRARTTLANVNIAALTPSESVFFEETWMAAYQKTHDTDPNNADDDIGVRSVIVDETVESQARRSLWGFTTFYIADVWALLESTCYLCGDNSLSAVDDYVSPSQYTSSTSSSGGLRGLRMVQNRHSKHRFETLLCEMLRDGPEVFHDVQDCAVTIV